MFGLCCWESEYKTKHYKRLIRIRLINFNMASLDNSNNSINDDNINNPSTSHQNANNDTVASSADSLQLSMLESKPDSEMIKCVG